MTPVVAQSSTKQKLQAKLTGAAIGPRHPICRGDFAAIVFCGATRDFGELPGEPTAHAIHKFALPDPRLRSGEDFAHAAGASLCRWPSDEIEPTDGVCFVFVDASNPHAQSLLASGAELDRHLVILDQAAPNDETLEFEARIEQFASGLPADGKIVVLGYGHQGRQIARILANECHFNREQILIHESNKDSRREALADGFAVMDTDQWLTSASAVVYSPLMRHERLHQLLERAAHDGRSTFDNSQPSSGLRQFVRHGCFALDAAADGALTVNGDSIAARPHGLSLVAQVIREDRRRINGCEFLHLQSAGCFNVSSGERAVDLVRHDIIGGLSPSTFATSRPTSIFISLRNRPDLGYFAARQLGSRLWPQATHSVFPSEHVLDLGATEFERLLQGHMVGREVASTMQTPAQRATLGIVARHYAANRPIVEIGSAFGGSALLVAAATDGDRPPMYSIDPEASTRDIMRFAFQREGHLDRLIQIIKRSENAITDLDHLHEKAGLVFIDGLHTAPGVRADYVNYAPLVAPGGALLFHDVCPQIHSVMRIVFDEVLADPRFEIKCLVDGLAVFERRCD